ncbi:hypothetical protein ACHAWF_013037 [Thalassiosira exigua]
MYGADGRCTSEGSESSESTTGSGENANFEEENSGPKHSPVDSDKRTTSLFSKNGHDLLRKRTVLKTTLKGMFSNDTHRRTLATYFMGSKNMGEENVKGDGAIPPDEPTNPSITFIAVMGDRHFITASNSDKGIKLFRQDAPSDDIDSKVKFVREYPGHTGAVSALAVLDTKGRFLSAGKDKTLRLWDSRLNCDDETEDPPTLLATFNPPGRWVHSVAVLDEGSYVRPTDEIDADMLNAVAKKTVLEGAAAVHRAAVQREIIECSGSFATASKNCTDINIWEMAVSEQRGVESFNGNFAEINLIQVLEHDTAITAMEVAVTRNRILSGDVRGNVTLWERQRRWSKKKWNQVCKFTPHYRRPTKLSTPEDALSESVTSLCFLGERGGETKFVLGTKSGKLRVWDIDKTTANQDRRKDHALASIKITSNSLACMRMLPPVKDPNTGAECFSIRSSPPASTLTVNFSSDR